MTHATKYIKVNDLLNFYAIFEVQNAYNATTFSVSSNDKLHEVYAANDFIIVRS